MFDRVDTWILIGIALYLITCGLIALLDARRKRIDALLLDISALRRELDHARADLETALARDEAKRCHYVRLRDDENERLRRENIALRAIIGGRIKSAHDRMEVHAK